MMKSHRRASWLVAGLLSLSLMVAGRAEAYGPFRWPEPGPPEMGDPDTPGSPQAVGWRVWIAEFGRSTRTYARGRFSSLQTFNRLRVIGSTLGGHDSR
jgi:hypothetical protein